MFASQYACTAVARCNFVSRAKSSDLMTDLPTAKLMLVKRTMMSLDPWPGSAGSGPSCVLGIMSRPEQIRTNRFEFRSPEHRFVLSTTVQGRRRFWATWSFLSASAKVFGAIRFQDDSWDDLKTT